MMKNRAIDNLSAGSFSIILHVTLLALVVFGMDLKSTQYIAAPPKVDIVQATVMDEADVLEEMARQQQYEDEKHQQEQERQNEIDNKLQQAQQELEIKKQEMLEQQKQADIEQKQRKLAAQQKRKEIAALEQQRKTEELKKQQIKQERLIAEQKQRLAEANRKAEEKKRLEAKEKARKAEEKEKKRLTKIKEEKRKAQEKTDREAAKLKAERDETDRLLKESLATEAREQEDKRINGVVNEYVAIIKLRVKRYWIKPTSAEIGLQCTLQVSLFSDGGVKRVKVDESSGNALFDRSAEAAVYKASPLRIPTDPKAAAKFKSFKFVFKPD